jgi:hypothetical protein
LLCVKQKEKLIHSIIHIHWFSHPQVTIDERRNNLLKTSNSCCCCCCRIFNSFCLKSILKSKNVIRIEIHRLGRRMCWMVTQ